jgi:hypothetical protein
MCKFHVFYDSRPRSVIITLGVQPYRVPKVVPTTVISLISKKQCLKVISKIAKFILFMFWL